MTTIRVLLVVSMACLVGCGAGPKRFFLHRDHRVNLGLTEAEIQALPFYISRDLLLQARSAEGNVQAVVIEKHAEGEVTEVGEDWLKVRFNDGQTPAISFLTDTDKREDTYWLAADTGGGLQKVTGLKEKEFTRDGQTYTVSNGSDAQLQVAEKDIEELIEERTGE